MHKCAYTTEDLKNLKLQTSHIVKAECESFGLRDGEIVDCCLLGLWRHVVLQVTNISEDSEHRSES
jgi:hypothetical protein